MKEPILNQLRWLVDNTNWRCDFALDGSNQNSHRGTMTPLLFVVPRRQNGTTRTISIDQVDMAVVMLEHDLEHWYLIPENKDGDDLQEDIGPFDTLKEAVTYASLLFS